jgi:hypothetical protein
MENKNFFSKSLKDSDKLIDINENPSNVKDLTISDESSIKDDTIDLNILTKLMSHNYREILHEMFAKEELFKNIDKLSIPTRDKIYQLIQELTNFFPGLNFLKNLNKQEKNFRNIFIGPTISDLQNFNEPSMYTIKLAEYEECLREEDELMKCKYPLETNFLERFRLMIFTIQVFVLLINKHILKLDINSNIFFTQLSWDDFNINFGDYGPRTKFTILLFFKNFIFEDDFTINLLINFRKISEIFKDVDLKIFDSTTQKIL